MATTENDTQCIATEMRQLRADLTRIAESLNELMRQHGAEAFGKAQDAADKIWEEARKRTDGIAKEIEAKPVVAALGAFGLGLLLGVIFSGRRG